MTSVIFSNPGEANLTALTTMGLNVKEGESPIGFFGTGFKYAIARLLREGAKIKLYVGTTEHVFSTRSLEVRGKTFQIIYLDEQTLNITTELGKNWELWAAFRELHSNSLDEGGSSTVGTFYGPTSGDTNIVVTLDSFIDIAMKKNIIFLEGLPLIANDECEVFHQNGTSLTYYRGVRASPKDWPCSQYYTYNIKTTATLSEDRQLTSPYVVFAVLGKFFLTKLTDENILNTIMTAQAGEADCIEKYFSFYDKPSETLLRVVRSRIANNKPVWAKLYEYVKAYDKTLSQIDVVHLDEMMQLTLDKATMFIEALGINFGERKIVAVKNINISEIRVDEVRVPVDAFNSSETLTRNLLSAHFDHEFPALIKGYIALAQKHLKQLV